jgi:hypothetical protein
MYFNWCGPIKVPAPCMYAHKIAEFYFNIKEGISKKQKVVSDVMKKYGSEV